MEQTVALTEKIREILAHFAIGKDIVSFKELKIGHINPTFRFSVREKDGEVAYILQKINDGIFHDVAGLMRNIELTTAHIRAKLVDKGGDTKRGTLTLVPTLDGKSYVECDGGFWRIYLFIGGARTYDSAENADMFRKVGYAFGEFQRQLADFDAAQLKETIPDFHDTPKRYETFLKTVASNPVGRAREAAEEIAFVRARSGKLGYMMDGIRSGSIPLRVTHNDTKLNNVMIDDETHLPICVLDLDTVMPGSVLADFGDAIRFGASSGAEDETDLEKIYVRLDMYEAFADGFLKAVGDTLTDAERNGLPMGAYLMTLECGMRFLTDYIDGDHYFHVEYPQHNLDRARNQFRLVADMEEKMERMQKIIEKLSRKAE